MYYVYVLKCADGDLYTGYSANLRNRVRQHKDGDAFSTRHRRPVEMLFYEAFLDDDDARRREKYMKTSAGKRAIKLMLRCHFAGVANAERYPARLDSKAHERQA